MVENKQTAATDTKQLFAVALNFSGTFSLFPVRTGYGADHGHREWSRVTYLEG